MTSRTRVNRRFLRWQRYLDHYGGRWSRNQGDRFAAFTAPPGALRAYNAWARAYNKRGSR